MLEDSNTFREVMSGVCTPVTVITALRRGSPYGTTVSAFMSLSMAPPMILVSLDRGSRLLRVVREVGRFGVNVLSREQADLAANFATKGGTDKFTGVGWHPDTGVPRLPGVSGFLACQVAEFVEGGDHLIVLGDVLAADSVVCAPLTYHKRAFGTHAALAEQRS
jgi:flavin reductase (DIM6/NTAB) family NADH-FMN oxidoreductase RutF